ncbi:Histidine utilization repressor [Candidatus Burkholderia pumila]|uniref:Histidine utilization repressor n=1 Tax=Candidatus Burkholderia pumila TaxID=1090375 RepID=A0ABR5HP86_9BURK|nr:Histidine utilization repressor [Candidatus Burkholderia pumila]
MSTPASYQEIKDYILRRIHVGEWKEGDLVPSENELAREFKVARMTVNRAVRELTAEQVLTRVQGAGTCSAQPKYSSTLVEIRSISDAIAARGHRYRAEVLHLGASIVDDALAIEMQLAAGSPVFHSRVLHFENDASVQMEERYVNPALAPEYARQDFTTTTPNQYLMVTAPLQRVEYRIEASVPSAEIRHTPAMSEHEPCLMLHRQPSIRAVAHIRMHGEAELADVKRQRFVLIVHIHADHIDSLIHETSSMDGRIWRSRLAAPLLQNCDREVRALRGFQHVAGNAFE